jgi:WhiB family transcriptional regulator, redox-sensing transcriptional regulator
VVVRAGRYLRDVLDLPLEDVSWHEEAACRDAPNPDAWFPERGQTTARARAVCAECVVKGECLSYALEHEDAFHFGVWGGTTPKERRQLVAHPRDKRRRSHEPTGRDGGWGATRSEVGRLLDAGYSQAEVARELGLTRQAISQHAARL